uniref:C2 domain-containing protein n=2 Tax=Chrysotila carterae TaxID=13221 RepID=A0A7S4B2N6_CHRCT
MRSKTIRKTLSPQWDERFTFHGILGELIEEPLLIKLWDYDVASLNDGMGEIEVPLDAVLENGQISLPHEPLYGASSGTLSVRVAWFPYAGQGTAVMRLLRCGRMVSTKQHAKPQADHLLRATIAIDIVGFIGVILLGSADIIYRMHGPAEPLAFFTDFFPLWWDYFTLASDGLERGVLWYLSIVSIVHCLPILVFMLPTIGNILVRLEPTAYDESGALRLTLSGAKMVAKHKKKERMLSTDPQYSNRFEKTGKKTGKLVVPVGKPPASTTMM